MFQNYEAELVRLPSRVSVHCKNTVVYETHLPRFLFFNKKNICRKLSWDECKPMQYICKSTSESDWSDITM